MFTGRAFLEFARDCSSIPNSEAADRSAISRAYYAVFWSARAHCETTLQQTVSTGPEAHREVARIIERVHGGRVADRIAVMRRLRNDADYLLHYSAVSRDVQFALDEATELVRAFSR